MKGWPKCVGRPARARARALKIKAWSVPAIVCTGSLVLEPCRVQQIRLASQLRQGQEAHKVSSPAGASPSKLGGVGSASSEGPGKFRDTKF